MNKYDNDYDYTEPNGVTPLEWFCFTVIALSLLVIFW